ncbi:MAG: hypothetical protein ABGW77_02015 [Campylobacterales bacterium]
MANIEQLDRKKALLIGGALGLGTMVALTPVVMKKVMDKGLERKLALLEERGIQFQLKEEKSGYLKSDKLYRVSIQWEGGQLIGEVELEYYNLPVTVVHFTGKGEKVEGSGTQFLSTIWEKFQVKGESGDLNHFTYQVLPMGGEGWQISQMEGELYISNGEIKNRLEGGEIQFQWGDRENWFKIYNFTSISNYRPKVQTSQFRGNLEGKISEYHLVLPNLGVNTIWSGDLSALNLNWGAIIPQLQLQGPAGGWVLKEGKIELQVENLPAQLVIGGEFTPSKLARLTGALQLKVGDLLQQGRDLGGGTLSLKLTSKKGGTSTLPFSLPFQLEVDYWGAPLFTEKVLSPFLMLTGAPQQGVPLLKKEGNRVTLHLKIDLESGEILPL